MATICPKDGKSCIDDVCRGSGVCGITGYDLWDECQRCHGVYSTELGVDCACEPCDDYDEDGSPHSVPPHCEQPDHYYPEVDWICDQCLDEHNVSAALTPAPDTGRER